MLKKQKIRRTQNAVMTSVDVLLFQEDKYFVAYCPALEVSSYGKSEQEAKLAFDEALDIFIQETEKKGSFEKALLKLGWSLRQVPHPSYIPPRTKLAGLSKLSYKKNTSRFKEKVALPL
jgi:predicted RNase H-like HicB family nuclease